MIDNQLYSAGQLIILGDFNYHLDCINNSLATQFKSLLESSDFSQHVVGPTHIHGHTLDLVITCSSEQFISEIRTYKFTVSDHYFVKFGLPVSKPQPARKLIEFRTLNKIDYTSFRNDLSGLIGSTSPVDNVESLVALYNKGLKATLDNHAPMKHKYSTVRPYNPWYDDEIHMAKLAKRKPRSRPAHVVLLCMKKDTPFIVIL